MRPLPLLILPALALLLPSCDSVKSKALAILDKKIEETGGDSGAGGEGAEPGADAGPQVAVRQVTSSDYSSFINLPGRVVVVDYYADWCPPCRRLAPVLEGIAKSSNGKVLLGKVDVDKDGGLGQKNGVSNIPDVRIFVNGKQVERMVGPSGEVARQKIQAHVSKLAPAPAKPKPKPEPPADKPKPEPAKPTDKPKDGDKPADPEKPGEEPKIKKMDKDWLPPGIQRKGT